MGVLGACGSESVGLEVPEAKGARSAFLATFTDDRTKVLLAFDLDASGDLGLTTTADGGDRIFVGFSSNQLSSAFLEPGPIALDPASKKTLPRIDEGYLARVTPSEIGTAIRLDEWPSPLDALRIAEPTVPRCGASGGCYATEEDEATQHCEPCAPETPALPEPPEPPSVAPAACPAGFGPAVVDGNEVVCWPPSLPECGPETAWLDSATCASLGPECALDGWPTDVDPGAVFVDPDASAGGAGSRDAPYALLVEALASGATTIALRRGRHELSGSVAPGTKLVGACALGTIVSGSVSSEGALALSKLRIEGTSSVAASGAPLALSFVEVDGSIDARGLDAEDLVVRGATRISGPARVGRARLHGGAEAALGDVRLEQVRIDAAALRVGPSSVLEASTMVIFDAPGDAISISEGGRATLEHVFVARPERSHLVVRGHASVGHLVGVGATDGISVEGSKASARLEDLVVTKSLGAAVAVAGSSVSIARAALRGFDFAAMTVSSGRLVAEDLVLSGAGRAAVGTDCTLAIGRAAIEGSGTMVLTRCEATLSDLRARGPAITSVDGALSVARVQLEGGPFGVRLSGTTATLEDASFKDVGSGIMIDPTSVLDARRVFISGVDDIGICTRNREGAESVLRDVTITHVDGTLDVHCLERAESGAGIAQADGALLSIERFDISEVASAGLLLWRPDVVTLADGSVHASRVGIFSGRPNLGSELLRRVKLDGNDVAFSTELVAR
ncbi:MAG: hypothetical protein HYV07_18440 [Deltaproteobacteria bacterium]|nr:hypothetical protein [Deltaproteobacteria bacterium]